MHANLKKENSGYLSQFARISITANCVISGTIASIDSTLTEAVETVLPPYPLSVDVSKITGTSDIC